jgi:hypothetical protein
MSGWGQDSLEQRAKLAGFLQLDDPVRASDVLAVYSPSGSVLEKMDG